MIQITMYITINSIFIFAITSTSRVPVYFLPEQSINWAIVIFQFHFGWACYLLKNAWYSSFHQHFDLKIPLTYCLNNLSCSSLFIYHIVKWYLYRTVLQFLAVSWKDPAYYMLWNSKLDCVWGCTNHDTAKK